MLKFKVQLRVSYKNPKIFSKHELIIDFKPKVANVCLNSFSLINYLQEAKKATLIPI